MLVLSRKRDQCIVIGPDITIVIVDIRGDRVVVGIEAPKDVAVHRQEIQARIDAAAERTENTTGLVSGDQISST